MNKDEFQGGARYVGGKVEKAVGDTVDSRDWQVDGVVDQVAGGAQHLLRPRPVGRRGCRSTARPNSPTSGREAR